MPRIIVFNDPHYTRTPPECRGEKYHEEIMRKLHKTAQAAKSIKADVIACTGDWFHRKGKVSVREMNDMLELLSRWKRHYTVCGILGNHDVGGNVLDVIDSRPTGTFVSSGVMDLLDQEPVVIETNEGSIGITGTSYFRGCDSTDEKRIAMYGAKRPDDVDVHLHLAHGALVLSGSFIAPHTVSEDLVEILDKANRLPDIITCGHLHFYEGIKVIKASNKQVRICRIGSIARVASGDLDRSPSVLAILTKGKKVTCQKINLHETSVEDVRTVEDEMIPTGEQTERIRDFVTAIRAESESIEFVGHEQLLKRIVHDLAYGKDVLDNVMKLLENTS